MGISITNSEDVATVTISYPPYNTINFQYLQEFEKATKCLASENPKAIVFRWEGETTGYGADLREVVEHISQPDWKEWSRERLETVYRAVMNLRRTRSRKVAVVHGDVYGGSMELPLMTDYLIAEEGTTVCFPESALGGIPGFGGTGFIFERTGRHNTEMIIYTAGTLTAELANRIGLVDEIVPGGNGYEKAVLLSHETRFPERVVPNISLKPSDFKPFKRKIRVDDKEKEVIAKAAPLVIKELPTLMNSIEAATSSEERLRITIDTCYGLSLTEGYKEARLAFLNKKLPLWEQELTT